MLRDLPASRCNAGPDQPSATPAPTPSRAVDRLAPRRSMAAPIADADAGARRSPRSPLGASDAPSGTRAVAQPSDRSGRREAGSNQPAAADAAEVHRAGTVGAQGQKCASDARERRWRVARAGQPRIGPRSWRWPKPRRPTNAPSRTTGAPADEHVADGTADRDALVGRVVAGVVEVGCPEGPCGGRDRRARGRRRGRRRSRPSRPGRTGRAGVVARRSTIRSTVIRPAATPSL